MHLPPFRFRLLTFFTLVLAGLSPLLAAAGYSKTNVLFLMTDDYRAELASYGSQAKTPNLDRLAQRSVQFNRMYAQQAVCNPSRSSLLTGRRPDTLRVWSNSNHFRDQNPDVPTLPGWFKKNGYTSRCVGKIFHNWHTAVQGDPTSWSTPEFLHYANHGDDHPTSPPAQPGALMKSTRRYGNGPLCEALDVPDETYFDGRVAQEAVRVLHEIKDAPFFLAVGFWKPHAPFNAPKKYWNLYQRRQFESFNGRRPEGAPEIAFHASTEILGKNADASKVALEEAAELRHGYFANISFLDAQIGKVLDALDSEGLAERTVIVLISDHGYHLGEHTLWGKTSNFELDTRVPCFLSVPGGPNRGTQTQSLAELIDLFPTLTALCRLPTPAGLEGQNLEPALLNPTIQLRAGAFSQHPRPAYFDREPSKQPLAMGVSVRTPTLRYTEWRHWKTGETLARELYDALQDPAETRNQADSPAFSAELTNAAALLQKQFPPTPHP